MDNEYSAFGEITKQSGSMDDDFTHRFSTKPFDKETGLVVYELRYYDPIIGKWLSLDPIGEIGGVMLYGFVDNCPISFIDDLGREKKSSTPAGLHEYFKEKHASYVVPIKFDVWCVRPRNRPVVDKIFNVLSAGYWGGYEAFELQWGKGGRTINAPCDGGILFFRMFPSIGFPAEVGAPAGYTSKIQSPLTGTMGQAVTGCPQINQTGKTSKELFGMPSVTGYAPSFWFPKSYPSYTYNNAKFDLGRIIRHTTNGTTAEWVEKELFRHWDTMYKQCEGSGCSKAVNVKCNDIIEVQMGNRGNPEFWTKYKVTQYKSTASL